MVVSDCIGSELCVEIGRLVAIVYGYLASLYYCLRFPSDSLNYLCLFIWCSLVELALTCVLRIGVES